jgi:RNA-directed DNA polymerase
LVQVERHGCGEGGRLGDLVTPVSVQKLQRALHAKAKAAPAYRFYCVYDKVWRADVLAHAYAKCRANKGAPGVDEEEFADIEAYGVERWLEELKQSLREGTYRAEAVRRVFIEKRGGGGKLRPLGIPTVRDRVCQTAAMLVLEPIFEADLQPEQYAYRPGRNALEAVSEVHRLLNTGHRAVVDADLSGYFDSIPHAELMKSVARRVVDRQMLHLIKMWLRAPVEERGDDGRIKRSTDNRDQKRGTPQGAPISPLLSNLYMRRFLLGWKQSGLEQRLGARIVNYADDFVICCRHGADKALEATRQIMGRLKLTVNEMKTRVCRVPQDTFDFLGYSFGRNYAPGGRAYLGTRASKKSVARLVDSIHELTERSQYQEEATDLVGRLNRKLEGWANYFRLGAVSKAYRAIDAHVSMRLRQWLSGKHQQTGRGIQRYSDTYLYEHLGLIRLSSRPRSVLWAKA